MTAADAVPIHGDEGLCPGPLPTWTVRMGDYTFTLKARDYEHAVVWVEAYCASQGIERRGAEFMRDDTAKVA